MKISDIPSSIGGLQILLFAENDDSVKFLDQLNLIVNNEKIGESRYLAICRESHGEKNVLLVFSDDSSNIKGLLTVGSVSDGMEVAEKSYKGITDNWMEADCSDEKKEITAFELNKCTFCEKLSREVAGLHGTEKALICNECIEYFYDLVNKSE